jgi:hypothetical protein
VRLHSRRRECGILSDDEGVERKLSDAAQIRYGRTFSAELPFLGGQIVAHDYHLRHPDHSKGQRAEFMIHREL